MSNGVGYEMAWKILKNIIEQLKKSQIYAARSASVRVSERDRAQGRAFMADIILEEMDYMEEGIAAMRGDEADE